MIHSRLAKLATIAAALAAFTGAVHAQEALKIAIMDIEKVRASYWKTQMSMKQVAERDADFKKVEQGMLDDLRQIVEDFNRLAQSAQDPANSEAKREADASICFAFCLGVSRILRALGESIKILHDLPQVIQHSLLYLFEIGIPLCHLLH